MMPASSDGCDSQALSYGAEGWTDTEQSAFDALIAFMQEHTSNRILLPREAWYRVADLMSRYPAMTEDDTEFTIVNALVCDPEDRRVHFVVLGKKIYRGE